MLVVQLDPPALVPTTFKPIPSREAQAVVLNVLVVLLQVSLNSLSQPGAMEAVRHARDVFCGLFDGFILVT